MLQITRTKHSRPAKLCVRREHIYSLDAIYSRADRHARQNLSLTALAAAVERKRHELVLYMYSQRQMVESEKRMRK